MTPQEHSPQENYRKLKEYSLLQGAELFGVADISTLKDEFAFDKELLAPYTAAISLGVRVLSSTMEEVTENPTPLYFRTYRTLNMFLDQLGLKIGIFLEAQGFRAIPIPASQVLDWKKQNAHLSHKKIALEAGLGWIGRNNLLVTEKLGSAVRLLTVLTDMPLTFDAPAGSGCGECRACIEACPAHAIHEDPAHFGHVQCFEQLKEFHRQRLAEQYICGVCIKACRGKAR
jgi:epoxyqueuosine reductase